MFGGAALDPPPVDPFAATSLSDPLRPGGMYRLPGTFRFPVTFSLSLVFSAAGADLIGAGACFVFFMRTSGALILLPLFIEEISLGGLRAGAENTGGLEESAKAIFQYTKTNSVDAHPWSPCLVIHLDMCVGTP
ncbi:hypothetical protein LINPERHAP1_LOCUS39547 [Linum perenne]